MRTVYGTASNTWIGIDGTPYMEVIIHTFEGMSSLEEMRNKQEWRFGTDPERLRAISKKLVAMADEADREVEKALNKIVEELK